MKYRVSKKAEQDLIDIYMYSASRHGTLQADAYQTRLQKACSALAERSDLGRHCPELFPGVHRFNCQSHIVFYETLDSPDHSIEIVRVLHERMDPGRHFEE